MKSLDWRSAIRSSKDLSRYQQGDPWQFRFADVSSYYGKTLKYTVLGKLRGAQKRARRLLGLAT